MVDVRVNDEYEFMDRLYYNLPASTTLMDEIFAGQRADTAVALAAKQLKEHGLVKYGRYRNHQLAMANGFVTRANRVLVPGGLRELVLTRIDNASHPGVNRTFHLLRSQFTWDGMRRDVRRFCNQCDICQRGKGKNKNNEPLEPIRSACEPRHIVAFDVATLPWSSERHHYFLLVTDLFSKWVEIAPMHDQTSESIITALSTFWIYRHGPPEALLSDQGPNVDGHAVRIVLGEMGVKKLRSSPYHQQGDGQAERNRQSVKQTLRCILSKRELAKDCWPAILQEVAHTLNTLPSAGTQLTSFHIMPGVEPIPNPRHHTGGDPIMV